MAVVFYLLPIAIFTQWSLLPNAPKLEPKTVTPGVTSTSHEVFTGSHIMSIAEQAISSNLARLLLVVWGIGALTFATWQIFCYQKFTKTMKQNTSPVLEDGEIFHQLIQLKERLQIKVRVDIAYSPIVKSPLLIGLIKPKILLPISEHLDMDIGMVLHHELVHLKRKDLWVKMGLLGVGALHWFNPFVYILRKDIHRWSEWSCDEEVVKEMNSAERKRYGQTILNVMIGSSDLPVRFCTALTGDGQQLKRRLMMMLNVKSLKKKSVFLATITVLVIGIIGTSTAVWAENNSLEVDGGETEQIPFETKEGSVVGNNLEYDFTFEALTPTQQNHVTKEMAHYYLDGEGNVVHFSELDTNSVPFESLNAQQKKQAEKEIGHYSLEMVRENTKE